MTSEQGPEDLASDGWKAAPRPTLTEDHYVCLRAAENNTIPDINRTRYRIALCEVRSWNLVLASSFKLTPLGEKALGEHRSAMAKRRAAR